jgi:endonuclease G
MIHRRIFAAVIIYALLVLPLVAKEVHLSERNPAPIVTAPSAPSTSTTLVISQYEAGTSANAAEEFVEIHNISNVTIDLNGYRVVYRSSAGTNDLGPIAAWTTSTPLAAGAYYLIGSDVYNTSHPGSANLTYSTNGFSTSGNSGGLAIRQGATNTGTLIDALGWGTATNALFEGTRAGAPGNLGSSLARLNSGCQDTDNNASDFSLQSPSAPRNTSTTSFVCGAPLPSNPTGSGSASPNNPNAGDTILVTVVVTPGTNPASTGIGVVTDLSSIGHSATQTLFDDGTNGDAIPGDNVFSLSITVATGTAGGIKTINFAVLDAQDRGSSGSFQITVQGTSDPGGTGSARPNTVLPGASTTLTFNATPGTLPASTSITVTANLASIGGSASQSLADSGDNRIFTFLATVANGTSFGLKTLPVTITDAEGRTGSGTIQLTVQSPADPAHVAAEHEIIGNPTSAGSSDANDWLIERNQYVASYNCAKGIPNWVEWHLDTSWLGSASRTDNYRAQTDIPLPPGCYQVQGSDYSGNVNNGGFDRGHDCPSGDRTNDAVPDNDATFIMTNFIPQAPNNNQGIWNDMEGYLRSQLSGGNEIYTWMGNAGQGGVGLNGFATTVANGHVVVPAYVWRVVMILPVGAGDVSRVDANTRVFAVLTPNIQTSAGLNSNWMTYICPVSKIEQLTGMNFFPNVPAATTAVLKQKIDPLLAAQTIGSGTMTNLTLTYPETYMTGNVTVTGTLTLGPETLNTTSSNGATNYTITLAPGATVSRINGGMVTGNLEKQYNASGQSFTYPVGTLNGYSPVTANLTGLNTNPSSLAVKAVQGIEPNAVAQNTALKRYWTLTETGDLTTNLVFNYLDADVPSGTPESSLELDKYEGIFNQWPATIDTSANTVTTTAPVSEFSDWTLLPNGTTPTPTPTPLTPPTIQFSASNYSIDEGGAHIDVTVTRTGDTSRAATVDYGTFDEPAGAGHASQTSDYQIALGTLTFAPGETSKTFRVLVVDDSLVESLETIGLQLSNPTGDNVTLGSPSTAEISILENDVASTTVNPYDNARFFVRQHYLDFLNRDPDQSGWDFWTSEITQCGTDASCTQVKRINVSAAYFLSIEFQGTGYEAYLTHRASFGPTAGTSPAPVLYSNFMHDVQELGKNYVFGAPGADVVLETNKVAYFNEFVGRSAFLTKYPLSLTNAQYVDALLTTASVSTTGTFRDSLLSDLNAGAKTRSTVLRAVVESSTLQTREFNRGFVTMEYFGYLRRDPDTEGLNFWLQKLNDLNGNYIQAEMVKAFIESLEDRQRFGNP